MSKQNGITYTDEPNAVTIRITGKAYANLRKIADIMNAASWTENDYTPAWAVRYWVGDFIDRIADTPATCNWSNISELAADIEDNIDTEAEGDEDKARRDELHTAFKSAGFYA